MKYYFLESRKHGYVDIGLFRSKYTAMAYMFRLARESKPGLTLNLYNANDIHLGYIKTGGNHNWYWTKNIDE